MVMINELVLPGEGVKLRYARLNPEYGITSFITQIIGASRYSPVTLFHANESKLPRRALTAALTLRQRGIINIRRTSALACGPWKGECTSTFTNAERQCGSRSRREQDPGVSLASYCNDISTKILPMSVPFDDRIMVPPAEPTKVRTGLVVCSWVLRKYSVDSLKCPAGINA